jgi:hypothetical protein
MTTRVKKTTTASKRLTIFLHPSIIKHARAQAIFEDLTLTALVEKALLSYLPKETVIKAVVPPRESSLR